MNGTFSFQFYPKLITESQESINSSNAKKLPKRIYYTQVNTAEKYSAITTTSKLIFINVDVQGSSYLPPSHKATLSSWILSYIALS